MENKGVKQTIKALYNVRSYMTFPRFEGVMKQIDITNRSELLTLWDIWNKGLISALNSPQFSEKIIDAIVEYEKNCEVASVPYRRGETPSLWYKIYYTEPDGHTYFRELDLLSYDGAKAYCTLLEPKKEGGVNKIVDILPKVAEIAKDKTDHHRSTEYVNVYEHDIYHCSDDFKWGDRVIVYADDAFRELLYTEKYGYLTANGEANTDKDGFEFNTEMLNMSEGKYNQHAITLQSHYRYMGNLAVDLHLLGNPKKIKQ